MANTNPFKYTDRTYNTILSSINQDKNLADKPEWFKRLIAGLGDTFSVIVDAIANDSLLLSALTRDSTQALLKLIDYEIGLPATSDGVQVFNVKTTTPNGTTFTSSDLIAATQGSLTVSSKKYQSRSSVTYNLSISNFVRTDSVTFTTAFDYSYTGKKVQLITTDTLPSPLQTGTDYFIIYLSSTTFSLATSIDNAFDEIAIETTDAGVGTHTAELYSFEATLYQQEERPSQVIGTSDGATGFQEFDLPDTGVLTDTLVITIGGDIWTEVDTLVESESDDKVYKILNKSDGIITVQFGNDEYGKIPEQLEITAEYFVGGGSNSNATALNSINVYAGTNSEITSTTNGESFTGGDDEQDIEEAKRIGPLLLKARNRFVTTEDGEVLALNLGGTSYVNVIRNAFGVLTVNVVAIANGGGNPSASKKTEIQDELTNKSILESVSVTVSDATLSPPTVDVDVKIKTGFSFSEVETQLDLAIKLFFTETGREIQSRYLSDGLEEAINLINVIFGTSFTTTDSWIETLIENLEPISFGQIINDSDIVAYTKSNVEGIDDITYNSPSFPINLGDTEITTHTGISITINEVT